MRVVAVFYRYDRVNKELKYGASIFRTEKKPESKCFVEKCNKQAHLETAKKRFNKLPVIVKDVEDTSNLRDFNLKIRRMIYQNGVHSKK